MGDLSGFKKSYDIFKTVTEDKNVVDAITIFYDEFMQQIFNLTENQLQTGFICEGRDSEVTAFIDNNVLFVKYESLNALKDITFHVAIENLDYNLFDLKPNQLKNSVSLGFGLKNSTKIDWFKLFYFTNINGDIRLSATEFDKEVGKSLVSYRIDESFFKKFKLVGVTKSFSKFSSLSTENKMKLALNILENDTNVMMYIKPAKERLDEVECIEGGKLKLQFKNGSNLVTILIDSEKELGDILTKSNIEGNFAKVKVEGENGFVINRSYGLTNGVVGNPFRYKDDTYVQYFRGNSYVLLTGKSKKEKNGLKLEEERKVVCEIQENIIEKALINRDLTK